MVNRQYQKHDRTHFFKYTSASTAKLILQNKTLKYSSPLLFNDPFDVQTEVLFNFDIDSLPDLILQEIEEIILEKKTINLNKGDEWAKAMLLLKDKIREYGYSKELVRNLFSPFLSILAELTEATRKEYNDVWQSDLLPRMRVLSLSERNDIILMWSHYAKEHSGVVFKLTVLPEEYNHEGNSLCIAEPIRYKQTPSSFYSAKDWVEETIGIKKIDHEKLYFDYAYTKSNIWEHEKEWRVWDFLPKPKAETKLYSYYSLKTREISAIYFGINTEEKDKKDIIVLAKLINPEIQFYQAKKGVGKYKLDFFEI